MASVFYPFNVGICSINAAKHCWRSRSSLCHSGLMTSYGHDAVRCSVLTASCLSWHLFLLEFSYEPKSWAFLCVSSVRWLLVSSWASPLSPQRCPHAAILRSSEHTQLQGSEVRAWQSPRRLFVDAAPIRLERLFLPPNFLSLCESWGS